MSRDSLRAVLRILVSRKSGMISMSNILSATNLDSNQVEKALIELKKLGYIRSSSSVIINSSLFSVTGAGVDIFRKGF